MDRKKILIGLGVLAVAGVGYFLYKKNLRDKRVQAERRKCEGQGGTWASKGKNKWVCEGIPKK